MAILSLSLMIQTIINEIPRRREKDFDSKNFNDLLDQISQKDIFPNAMVSPEFQNIDRDLVLILSQKYYDNVNIYGQLSSQDYSALRNVTENLILFAESQNAYQIYGFLQGEKSNALFQSIQNDANFYAFQKQFLIQKCISGDLKTVKFLINFLQINVNEARNKKVQSLLHIAAKNGHKALVEYLISKGAEIDALDGDMKTPLQLATKKGHIEVVQTLLSKGADQEKENMKFMSARKYAEKFPQIIKLFNNNK